MKIAYILGLLCMIGATIGLDTDGTDKAKFMFFTGKTFDENDVYDFKDLHLISQNTKYDQNRTTMLYLHGYEEAPSNESVHTVIEAYLTRTDHNIIVLDWSQLAGGDYILNSLTNAVKLSQPVAQILQSWCASGDCNFDRFHVVSNSFGAQFAGMIGRNIIHNSKNEQILGRITGLDPANPPYFPALSNFALSKNDAKFVDIIHTDGGLYGAPIATGHVDFWPNGGVTLQPGCPTRNFIPLSSIDLCSHRRAWRLYSESVGTPGSTFIGIKASNWIGFKLGKTERDSIAVMGIDCTPQTPEGSYYLQTNSNMPFARGMDGTRYMRPNQIVDISLLTA